MADPSTYRPRTSDIPAQPGVYRFFDEESRVIYVGKAKNLRARLVNYFQDLSQLHPRTQQMVTTACRVQWTIVASEVEALTLEFTWIKQFNPRFNVIYKDDKSYPYLSVSLGEQFPRVRVTRDAKRKGDRYFGPYTAVWAIRESIDLLLRVFPMRSCSAGVFRRAQLSKRPCLLADIGKCSAPCVGQISEDDHRAMATELARFMDGRTGPILRDIETRMKKASANLEFEEAAKLRDDLVALRKVLEKNTVVLDDGTDADFFALHADDLDAAVHVFHIRGGRIRGTRGWVINRLDHADEQELMARLLEQIYGDYPDADGSKRGLEKEAKTSVDDVEHTPTTALPREILVSHEPANLRTITQWLSGKRGAKVSLRVPERGQKAQLMETVRTNAREALTLHKVKRAGDITARSQALEELAEALNLPGAPLRIECFDISHTAGTHQVGSMVVFEDGVPRKDAYRTFTIRQEGADDTAAMDEILTRRFTHRDDEISGQGIEDLGAGSESRGEDLVNGAASAELTIVAGRVKRRFSYRPDLLVVDGGLPQVNAAQACLERLGVTIPIIGLAKRLEEVWIPGDPYPLILPRTSSALYLLQHCRDESHRFAISAHRKKRTKAQTRSALDDIAGLGPSRQRALLTAFGSVKKICQASVEELTVVPGIGPHLAANIAAALGETEQS